jgi:hypothetical protein
MQKLDRLVWAAGTSFTAFGLSVGVRVSSAELLDPVLARIPTGWKLARSPVVDRLYSYVAGDAEIRPNVRPLHLLYGNIQRLARTEDPSQLLAVFESNLSSYFAQTPTPWLFVHAGVVTWKGQAIVIPGRSMSGKTTLVREFLKAGANYFSDEFAVLDGRGHVLPFPRDISVRENNHHDHSLRVRAKELGAKVGIGPLPIGLVLWTHYKAGCSWRPKLLSPARGVLALLDNTLTARQNPRRALRTLEASIRQAECIKSTRGEAKQVVDAILQHIENKIHFAGRTCIGTSISRKGELQNGQGSLGICS